MEKERVVFEDWLAKQDADIEKLWQEIRKRTRHFDIGSANVPMEDACMHDADSMQTNQAAEVAKSQIL